MMKKKKIKKVEKKSIKEIFSEIEIHMSDIESIQCSLLNLIDSVKDRKLTKLQRELLDECSEFYLF